MAAVMAVGALLLVVVVAGSRSCGPRESERGVERPAPRHAPAPTIMAGSAASLLVEKAEGTEGGSLRLEGQVIDEASQPVAGARVFIQGHDLATSSGPDGTFAFDKLVARTYRISAHKDELYAPAVTMRLRPSAEPVILRLRHGATLIVHVMAEQAAHGLAPLPGAHVGIDDVIDVVTDARGVARVQGLGTMFYEIKVRADGYRWESVTTMFADDPGGVVEHTVTLRRGAPVSGVVIDPDGKPVADATVEIQAVAGDSSGDRWSDWRKTDNTGAWQFPVVTAGTYQLEASSKLFGPGDELPLELDGMTARSGVVIHVERDGTLVGVVVDREGKPVAGAVAIADSGNASFDERTDTSGRFEMIGIESGYYDVSARSSDGGACEPRRVSISDGQRAEVRLDLVDSAITGRVVDSTGAPIALAQVSATQEGKGFKATFGHDTTDSLGHFDLGGLSPGNYDVQATLPDQADVMRFGNDQKKRIVKTGTRNVELVVPILATIKGRLLLDNKPLAHYGVYVLDDPRFSFMGEPKGVHASDGRFELRNVPPGTWGVVFVGRGTARKAIEKIEVTEGKVVDLGDVAMEHGIRISGTVRDAAGTAIVDALVRISGPPVGLQTEMQGWFQGRFESTTDATGAFVFDGIAPFGTPQSPVDIVASHPQYGASEPVGIPYVDGRVDLRIVSTGGVDGVIEGDTRAGGIVIAQKAGALHTTSSTSVGAAGAFQFDALTPGDYTLSLAAMPGKVGASTNVTVLPDQRVKAVIAMSKTRIVLTVSILGGSCSNIMLSPDTTDASRWRPDMGFQQCTEGRAELDVPPGVYRACPDGTTVNCSSITVAGSPPAQTVFIRPAGR